MSEPAVDAVSPFHVTSNSSEEALGELWATSNITAQACHFARNGTDDLIGTGFVARDMMQIVDALNEDGLLRYFGKMIGDLPLHVTEDWH